MVTITQCQGNELKWERKRELEQYIFSFLTYFTHILLSYFKFCKGRNEKAERKLLFLRSGPISQIRDLATSVQPEPNQSINTNRKQPNRISSLYWFDRTKSNCGNYVALSFPWRYFGKLACHLRLILAWPFGGWWWDKETMVRRLCKEIDNAFACFRSSDMNGWHVHTAVWTTLTAPLMIMKENQVDEERTKYGRLTEVQGSL